MEYQDSLSLRARTTVLATVSPSPSSYSENINTLKYAQLLQVTANGGRTNAKVKYYPQKTRLGDNAHEESQVLLVLTLPCFPLDKFR